MKVSDRIRPALSSRHGGVRPSVPLLTHLEVRSLRYSAPPCRDALQRRLVVQ